jgi:hypothetical protein
VVVPALATSITPGAHHATDDGLPGCAEIGDSPALTTAIWPTSWLRD